MEVSKAISVLITKWLRSLPNNVNDLKKLDAQTKRWRKPRVNDIFYKVKTCEFQMESRAWLFYGYSYIFRIYVLLKIVSHFLVCRQIWLTQKRILKWMTEFTIKPWTENLPMNERCQLKIPYHEAYALFLKRANSWSIENKDHFEMKIVLKISEK